MKALIELLLEYQQQHVGDAQQSSSAAADASDDEVVSWREVKAFLAMAEHALLSKQHAAEGATRHAARQAEKEATAREESSFLEEVLNDLQAEKEKMQSRVDVLAREKQILEREVELLREQVQGELQRAGSVYATATLARRSRELTDALPHCAAECLEQESPGPGQAAVRRMQAELGAEKLRGALLEQELKRFQLRALALERAGQAQQSALIGCLEEQERGWLERSAKASTPTSPGGPVEWHAARSERTVDDTSSHDGLRVEASGLSLPSSASGQTTPRTAGNTPPRPSPRHRAAAPLVNPTQEGGNEGLQGACAID
jgi:hypothetical protein